MNIRWLHSAANDGRPISPSVLLRICVEHYKGKYVVENAFRELKSFIEIRPFYVWTEEHVKARYDIAIRACFIDDYIYRKLQPIGDSLRKFHEHMAASGRVAELAKPTG